MKLRRGRSAKQASVQLPRCVLDSGGLTSLVGGSQRAREWLRWVIEHVILTSDPDDLERLLQDDPRVSVRAV